MIVSTGPVRVKMPNLLGDTEAAAVHRLIRAGLVVVVTEQVENAPAGNVVKQDPSAGKAVVAGSTARLMVALAPSMVTVPSLVGETEEAAVTTASGLGLVVAFANQTVGQPSRAGLVLAQSPLASIRVAKGSQIKLTIGRSALAAHPRANSSSTARG